MLKAERGEGLVQHEPRPRNRMRRLLSYRTSACVHSGRQIDLLQALRHEPQSLQRIGKA
jgi:hypothetical protein